MNHFFQLESLFFTSQQLETNVISNEPVPDPSTPQAVTRDWVKIAVPPPVIVNTRLGERVEIECEVIGSPMPEIQWLRGERIITHVSISQQTKKN